MYLYYILLKHLGGIENLLLLRQTISIYVLRIGSPVIRMYCKSNIIRIYFYKISTYLN